MRKSKFMVIKRYGCRFFFAYDPEAPDLLHIYVRHLTTPSNAMNTFMLGKSVWNEERYRFEIRTTLYTVYWLWLNQVAKKVLIISCFHT